jgi:hypothetical protein
MKSPVLVLAAALVALPALAAAPAEIPFANNGGIQDWRAENDRVIYVQGQNRQWYRAELMSDCIGLRYAETIGFDTEASGAFNRFSSIKVEGRNCPVSSFEKSDSPPKKEKKAKDAAQP